MICFTDINKVLHKKCPRCEALLIDGGRRDPLEEIYCVDNCGLVAMRNIWPADIYSIRVCLNKNYSIIWQQNGRSVFVRRTDIERTLKLPLLPYDISINKLKTYILFRQ